MSNPTTQQPPLTCPEENRLKESDVTFSTHYEDAPPTVLLNGMVRYDRLKKEHEMYIHGQWIPRSQLNNKKLEECMDLMTGSRVVIHDTTQKPRK